MADGLDLVVHALDGSVREADLSPGKNSIQVGAQHLCEALERLQLGAHSEFIHLRRCCSARQGCLYSQNSWKASFRYQARTSGVFQRTNVDSRSFWAWLRFQGFFSSSQRVPLTVTFSWEVSWRHSWRRTPCRTEEAVKRVAEAFLTAVSPV